MKNAFGMTMETIDGRPLLPGQTGRERAIFETPEVSGQVFCPQRLSHIAVMRCGQYQKKFNCQVGCPNAVTAKRIKEIADPEPSRISPLRRREYYADCQECGAPKKSYNASPRCATCGRKWNRRTKERSLRT